jgi:hypothetical protein
MEVWQQNFVNKSFCGVQGWPMIFTKGETPSIIDTINFPLII